MHFKEYKIANPEKKHCSKIIDFAKGTGDYVSLSVADMEVMALALQTLVEKGHEDKIRTVPKKPVNHFSESNKGIVERSQITEVFTGDSKKNQQTEEAPDVDANEENPEEGLEEYESDEDQEQEEDQEQDDQGLSEAERLHINESQEQERVTDGSNLVKADDELEVQITKEELQATTDKSNAQNNSYSTDSNIVKEAIDTKLWVEGKDWDLEDEEGWITKDNLNKLISSEVHQDEKKEELGVCVMTSDFAMQNILL